MNITIRTAVTQSDLSNIERIVRSTGFFTEEEVAIAIELVDEFLKKGENSGYRFIFAETDNTTVGYSCYGLIPCTQISFDLYWIAVDNNYRSKGIGRTLMNATEDAVIKLKGHQLFAETSDKPQYQPTRDFYESQGFVKVSQINDFYDYNDGRVIYRKILK